MACPAVLLDRLSLDRIGPAEATVGLISLPLPRELARDLRVDHPHGAMHPVGWWVRNEVPRRSLAFVVDDRGVPASLRLTGSARPEGAPCDRWRVTGHVTKEQLSYVRRSFADIAALRGVPYDDTTHVEGEVHLAYGQRTLTLQIAATGPDVTGRSAPSIEGERLFQWQNVQVDELWATPVCQAFRVGGIIYNGDTYLWADVFLLLFSNGVAQVAAHFVCTKLHIEGYDFQGLPAIRIAGEGLRPRAATLPADGLRFDLGAVKLNLEDAAILCSEEYPGRFEPQGDALWWWPFSRTFNPQLGGTPPREWAPGFARTVRFTFSLSEAAPVIARYRAPAWWYGVSGEPWPGGYLPVRGRFGHIAELTADTVRAGIQRGRFDGGNAGFGNDGYAGTGILRNYYLTGRPELFRDGLDYCYYWADLAVDHRDFTIRQWLGGWQWKTAAYSKFRDVLTGYLETGDPYLLDAAENCADAYWMWFRSNWPRSAIGRDSFELAGWALVRRFLRSERSVERTRELVRMIREVLQTRGMIGGQMGAGPHPGYISSLYMTGITMVSLTEVAAAEREEGHDEVVAMLERLVAKLDERFQLKDVEMFPSSYGDVPTWPWPATQNMIWTTLACHIYPQMARLTGETEAMAASIRRSVEVELPEADVWALQNRQGDNLLHPPYHDALVLGARISADGSGLELAPLVGPDLWPAEQTVSTPWGDLHITTELRDEQATLRFAAPAEFPISLTWGGATVGATSTGEVALQFAVELVGKA